jgi:hypothetical protein
MPGSAERRCESFAELVHYFPTICSLADPPGVLGEPPSGRTSGIAGLVYKSVRGVTRLVGGSVDALLGVAASLIAERPS